MNPHVDFLSAFSVGFWPRQLSEKGYRKRRFAKQRKMQCTTQMTDQRACLLIFILCTSGVMSTFVAGPFCLLSTQHVGRMTHTLLVVRIAPAVSAPFTSQCVWKVEGDRFPRSYLTAVGSTNIEHTCDFIGARK